MRIPHGIFDYKIETAGGGGGSFVSATGGTISYDKGRYRDWETDRKSTRLNSSHITRSRMPSSA